MASAANAGLLSTEEIARILDQFEAEAREKPTAMKGAVGSVRKLTAPDGAVYYVKKMVFSEGSKAEKAAKSEIYINEYLTDITPDILSRLLGSSIVPEGREWAAYLIFEGLEGMDALDYMRLHPSDDTINQILTCVREKVDILHEHDCAHGDLQPPNIFILTNTAGDYEGCRLIDFGNAKYLGSYDAGSEEEEVWERNKGRLYRRDAEFLDVLDSDLKKYRDIFAEQRRKGGYRRKTRRGYKKRKQTRRLHRRI
jgi:serine/threonine protein kinase